MVFIFIDLNQFLAELNVAIDLVNKTKFPVDTIRTCHCWLQLALCTYDNNFNV